MSKRKPFEKLVENKLPKAAASSPSSSVSSRSTRSRHSGDGSSRGSRVVPLLDDRDCAFLSDDKNTPSIINVTTTTRPPRPQPAQNTPVVASSTRSEPFTSQTKTPKVSNVTTTTAMPLPRGDTAAVSKPKPGQKRRRRKTTTTGDTTEDAGSVQSDPLQDSTRTRSRRRGGKRRRQTLATLPRHEESSHGDARLGYDAKAQGKKKQRASMSPSVVPSLQTIAEEGEEINSSPELQATRHMSPPLSSVNDDKEGDPQGAVQEPAVPSFPENDDEMDLASDEESLVSPTTAAEREVAEAQRFKEEQEEKGQQEDDEDEEQQQKPLEVGYKTPTGRAQLPSAPANSDPTTRTRTPAGPRTAVQSYPAGSKTQREKLRQICLYTPSDLIEGFQTTLAASKTSPKGSSSGKAAGRQRLSVLETLQPPSTPHHGKPFSGEDLQKIRTSRPDNAVVMQALMAAPDGDRETTQDQEDASSDGNCREPVSIKTVIASTAEKNARNAAGDEREKGEQDDDALSELTIDTTNNREASANSEAHTSRPATPAPSRRTPPAPRRKSQAKRRRTQSTETKTESPVAHSSSKPTRDVPKTALKAQSTEQKDKSPVAPSAGNATTKDAPMEFSISPSDSQTDAAIKSLQSGETLVSSRPAQVLVKRNNSNASKNEEVAKASGVCNSEEAWKKTHNANCHKSSTPRPESLVTAAAHGSSSSGHSQVTSQKGEDSKATISKSNADSPKVPPPEERQGQFPKHRQEMHWKHSHQQSESTHGDRHDPSPQRDMQKESSDMAGQQQELSRREEALVVSQQKHREDSGRTETSLRDEEGQLESECHRRSPQENIRERQYPRESPPLTEVRTVRLSGSVSAPSPRTSNQINASEEGVRQLSENHEPQLSPQASSDDDDGGEGGTHGSTRSHPLRYLERKTYTAERAGFKQMAPFLRFPNGEMFLHPPLPPGWQVSVCTRSERAYYWHPDFGRTYFPPIQLPSTDGKIHGYTPQYIVHCEGTIPPPHGLDIDVDIGYDYDDPEKSPSQTQQSREQSAMSGTSSIDDSRASERSNISLPDPSETEPNSELEHDLDSVAAPKSENSSQKSPDISSQDQATDEIDRSGASSSPSNKNAPIGETQVCDLKEDSKLEQEVKERSTDHDEDVDLGDGGEIVLYQRGNKDQSEMAPVAVCDASNPKAQQSFTPVPDGCVPDGNEETVDNDKMKGNHRKGPRSQDENRGQDEYFDDDEIPHNGESTSPFGGNEQAPRHSRSTVGYSPAPVDHLSLTGSSEMPLSPVQTADETGCGQPTTIVSVPRNFGTSLGSDHDSSENISVLGDGGASVIYPESPRRKETQSLGDHGSSIGGSIASRISLRVLHPPMPVCSLQNIGSLEMCESSKKRTKNVLAR